MVLLSSSDMVGGYTIPPLCDIDVLDEKSINYRLVHDYKNWFANR